MMVVEVRRFYIWGVVGFQTALIELGFQGGVDIRLVRCWLYRVQSLLQKNTTSTYTVWYIVCPWAACALTLPLRGLTESIICADQFYNR